MNNTLSERDFLSSAANDATETSANVSYLDFRRRSQTWHREIVEALCRLVRLPGGWDGYSGKPLRHDTFGFAVQLLNEHLGPSSPTPSVVPVGDGGVQIEWHENQLDVELYIAAPYKCELTVHDLCNGETRVTELTSDYRAVASALRELVDYNRNLGSLANAG